VKIRSRLIRASVLLPVGATLALLSACGASPSASTPDAAHGHDATVVTGQGDSGKPSLPDASSGSDRAPPSDATTGADASTTLDGSTQPETGHDAATEAGDGALQADANDGGATHDASLEAGDGSVPRDATKSDGGVFAEDASDVAIRDAAEDASHGVSSSPPTDAGGTDGAPHDAHYDSDAHGDAGVDSGFDAGPPALGYVGRIDLSQAAGPRFEWSGTQVIARFVGTGINIQMADYGNYFDVYLDGVLQPTQIMGVGGNGTTDYPLASGLTNGTHEVILYRRTEAQVSLTQILGVTFPPGGSLLPPPQRPNRRIEIVGDSISCGLGVLGVGPTCTPTNANEDHDDSYGALTARALNADLITIAWSGKGMYEDYGGATTSTMPDLYPYSMPTQPATATLWNFSEWTPDAVVINLGTNDFWNGDPGAQFESTYLSFVQTVRGHYPNAYIVCANGPLLVSPDFTTAETYITGVVSQMKAAGDTRIEYLSFGMQGAGNGYGCDYHPSAATHAIMATTLEAALSSALGW